MVDNETYAVMGIIGFLVIVVAAIYAINITLIFHFIWLMEMNSFYMSPMSFLIVGFNLLVICGLLAAMGIGE